MKKECLQCKKQIKINRKFCSKKCSNIFNGMIKTNQNHNKKKCLVCSKEQTFNNFSLFNKFDKFSGRKNICKKCSKAKKEREKRKRTWKNDAVKIMLMNSKYRAKKLKLVFSLKSEDIIIPKRCPVLNIPLFRSKKNNWNNSPSIDRIDNTKGYTKENIVIVSRRANILKKDASLQELQQLSKFYKKFMSQQKIESTVLS